MNILLVNYEFPPLGGGAGNATANIAHELAKMGENVHVLTSRFKGLPKREYKDGYKITRVPVLRKQIYRCTPFEMMTFLFSAIIYVLINNKKFKPNYTICFFSIPSGPIGWILKKLFRIPYMISLRGGDVPGHQPEQLKFLHKLTKPLIRIVWNFADALVANSEGLRATAIKSGTKKKIYVIPNGVDTVLYYPPINKLSYNKKLSILFVGRISFEKGLQYLLSALKYINRTIYFIKIVGDGPFLSEIKNLVKTFKLENNAEFIGWVSNNKELIKLYQNADFLVLPSLYEGMSNVVLEAMACGLPIIATRIAGNEELVREEKNGFLVKPGDVNELSTAITKFISNPELIGKMGIMSRKIIEEEYSWERTARQYKSILKLQ